VPCLFLGTMTLISYKLGQLKTDNAKAAAITGFLLSFIPPFAVIYIAVLLLKEDVDIV